MRPPWFLGWALAIIAALELAAQGKPLQFAVSVIVLILSVVWSGMRDQPPRNQLAFLIGRADGRFWDTYQILFEGGASAGNRSALLFERIDTKTPILRSVAVPHNH